MVQRNSIRGSHDLENASTSSMMSESLEFHKDTGVLVLPKCSDDGEAVLTLFIKLKCEILHVSVKFCEKLVSNAFAMDVHDDGQRKLPMLDHIVELS